MKARTQLIAVALLASCGGWATRASATEIWFAPAPVSVQTEITPVALAPVGERIITTRGCSDSLAPVGERVTTFTRSEEFTPAQMARIQAAANAAANNTTLSPIGERCGIGTNLVPHVWPVGAVGRSRIVYVPMTAPAPLAAVGERVTITRTKTIEPVQVLRTKRVVYTTEHLAPAPIGERVITKRVFIRRTRLDSLAPIGEYIPTRTVLAPAPYSADNDYCH